MNDLKHEEGLFRLFSEIEKASPKYAEILKGFYEEYKRAAHPKDKVAALFTIFVQKVIEQIKEPYQFSPYHKKVREPFDYYQMSHSLLEPLIDKERSSVFGKEELLHIENHLRKKENVVLLANHQTEADPYLIDFLLKQCGFSSLGYEMIFVAGERVITDPNAVPFSLGVDLLCIYSKKYVDSKSELKYQKQKHNTRTMKLMSQLLSEGGKIIYVAPSGGRDRRQEDNKLIPAPFDASSIEMFYLMAKKAKKKTHFFPLALLTYDLLPPPASLQKELGEKRKANHCPIHLSFGSEIDMEDFPGADNPDKSLKRESRASYIHSLVVKAYQEIK